MSDEITLAKALDERDKLEQQIHDLFMDYYRRFHLIVRGVNIQLETKQGYYLDSRGRFRGEIEDYIIDCVIEF